MNARRKAEQFDWRTIVREWQAVLEEASRQT
jgi:hypothetical protein